MSANREYKNSVFTALFKGPTELLELYNALSGRSLPSDTAVKIVTLEDVLFTRRRNDIAFVIGGKMVMLIEHQSTISENLPLRLLVYVARVYEKIIDGRAVYAKGLLKIPKPDFIVLYNGADPFPDERTLRLSDAYLDLEGISSDARGLLELEVRVININEGRNENIVKQSGTLSGYVAFTGKVRAKVDAGLELTAAVTGAVKECIAEGILVEFLKTNSSEVINMLTTEWDYELEKSVIRQEAHEEGREEGREEGVKAGVDLSARIMGSLIRKEPVEEIAVRYRVSVDDVISLQSVLKQIPA